MQETADVSITRRSPPDGPEVLTLNWDDPAHTGVAIITREALEGLLAELNEARALVWSQARRRR